MAAFSVGHYYVSGFVSKNGSFVYFSVSDVRYFPGDWYNHMLVRSAKDVKDYTGGPNGYTSLENFKEETKRFFEEV